MSETIDQLRAKVANLKDEADRIARRLHALESEKGALTKRLDEINGYYDRKFSELGKALDALSVAEEEEGKPRYTVMGCQCF